MPEPELVRDHLGVGDGVTRVFVGNLCRRPVLPASVVVTVLQADVVTKLGALVDPGVYWTRLSCNTAGALANETSTARGTVNYATAQIQVEFDTPPPDRAVLHLQWKWTPPRLRACEVQVRHPDTDELEWVSLEELRDALFRG